MDDLAKQHRSFRWTAVSSHPEKMSAGRPDRVQDVAVRDNLPWDKSRVYACGHPEMVRHARALLMEQGLPDHAFFSEAFVPSAETGASLPETKRHPILERVGPRFSVEGMLAARDHSILAVAQIAEKLEVGMTTAQALEMANAHLRGMGASHTWHPTYIRFGEDSPKTPRQKIDLNRKLRASDIAVVDIGPVWDGFEGDFGDTFVLGDAIIHR